MSRHRSSANPSSLSTLSSMSSHGRSAASPLPSFDDAVVSLLQSIALEEQSLALLLSTEADKTRAFVGRLLDYPTSPSNADIIRFNQTAIRLLDSVLMAEWLLLKKLDAVVQMQGPVRGNAGEAAKEKEKEQAEPFDNREGKPNEWERLDEDRFDY
ncbi:hypothetical protein [Paenibacillus koleovorans]|uniref:hypothetical protein n=1 Tax=Paenibacillus koleovorans TaxID=121608 RepID=UPI000FDC7ADC|nr:hypothetical protein [Paenibacillus koleovorans]